MNDYLFSTIIIAAALITGLILYLFATFLLKRLQRNIFLKKFEVHSKLLKSPLRSLIPGLCIIMILPLLRVPENIHTFISHFVNIWLIVSFSWFIIIVVHIIRDAILSRYDIDARDNLQARRVYTQIRVIGHIITVVILLLTAAFILMTFPKVRQIGVSLLASAGVFGIIIGFAAQKTLGNFIAGIQIAITQPIRLDDVVIVENEWGWIEEITLTYVVVRIWDLRRLIVPLSHFIEKPFQNWTRTSADILGSVFIYADYTIPVKEIRDELTRILENSSYWDKKVNVFQVTNATEKTVELRALMSASDSPTAWNLRCEVREKLLKFLQERFPECLPLTRVEMKSEQALTKSKSSQDVFK